MTINQTTPEPAAQGGSAPTVAQVVGLADALSAKADASALSSMVAGDDPRLSDARTPVEHEHQQADVAGLALTLSGKVDATDPRLTDARTPVAHTHGQSDITGLSAALSAKADANDPRLTDARPPTAHAHAQGDITGLAASLSAKQDASQKGQAGGYASLDGTGKVPPSQLPASGGGSAVSIVRKAADQAFTATAYADVADLSIPLQVGVDVAFEFLVVWSSAAATTGVAFALNGPAGPQLFCAVVETATSATAVAIRQDVAYDQGAASASIDAANTSRVCRIKGVVRASVAGNLVVRCKSEIANSAVTVKRGSWGSYF